MAKSYAENEQFFWHSLISPEKEASSQQRGHNCRTDQAPQVEGRSASPPLVEEDPMPETSQPRL